MSKILIVDSDKKSQKRLRDVLHNAHSDYQILCTDGENTLEIIKNEVPDLVLFDVMMPGNDGFELCLLLKADERYKDIPFLIITALNKLEHKIKGFKVGASDYLVKPINEVETIARVEAHLRIKRFQDRQKELNAELRRTQSTLLESSKMSAVGTLAAGVAHEFNNILQIITAATELYTVSPAADNAGRMVRTIQECSRRGRQIVKGLLDFSKKDEYQDLERVDLGELIAQNVALMEKLFRDNAIECEMELTTLPPFECYPGQLSQVVVNLIKNAVDAMRGSEIKKLKMFLKKCDCPDATCQGDPAEKTAKNKGCAIISVSDTGSGIPEIMKDKIFEPFVTTKGVVSGGNVTQPGTGLGLSISYGIVKRHRGFIHVESQEKKGSTFIVFLPF